MCFQRVGGSFRKDWKTLAERTQAGWKICGCVERGQTVRTPALRSYYSQDTGAINQCSPSNTHTYTHRRLDCETVGDCLYNQLIRRSCVSICVFTIPGSYPENSQARCLSCPSHHLCERKHKCWTETHKTSKAEVQHTDIGLNVCKSTCSECL